MTSREVSSGFCAFISLKLNRSCNYIWSPYIYNENIGNFSNYYTGKHIETILRKISWYWDSPEQYISYNYVAMYLSSLTETKISLFDFDAAERFCVSCNVPKETVFTLWGVCDQSLLGNVRLDTIVKTKYFLKNENIFSPTPLASITTLEEQLGFGKFYCKHEGISYKQGINEIMSPFLWLSI